MKLQATDIEKEKGNDYAVKMLQLINEFLGVKRFAMVGVSRIPKDFSRTLMREFLRRGYDVVPVNPYAKEIEGRQCFPKVQDIEPPVTCALLMTSKLQTDSIIADCADAGMSFVWMYGISGEKDISPNSLKLCRRYGLRVVAGYCPYMFIPSAPFYHKVHSAVWKMIGRSPS